MTTVVKTGIIASVVAVPAITVSALQVGSGSKSLFEITKEAELNSSKPIPNTMRNVRAKLTAAGYSRKSEDRLADFNENREAYPGGNFALGCHRLLFGGKNVKKATETTIKDHDNWVTTAPMSGYLGDNSEPLLGCSTASILDSNYPQEKVHEFELAVRRGDRGFLERITVWKNAKKAVSQLTIYKRDGKEKPWGTWYAVQRRDTNASNLETGNPVEGKWSDLEINVEEFKKAKYFVVWVDSPNGQTKSPQDKDMLENLGVRFKGQQKIFSSLAKTNNDSEWAFKFFGAEQNKTPLELKKDANNNKNKATYNSNIAADVEKFKGKWKDVKEFCKEQESKTGKLSYEDVERLRDYCYTNQPNKR